MIQLEYDNENYHSLNLERLIVIKYYQLLSLSMSLSRKYHNPYPSLIIQAIDNVELFLVDLVVFPLVNLMKNSNIKNTNSFNNSLVIVIIVIPLTTNS